MGGGDSSLCSHPAHSGSGCDSVTLALDVARESTVVCLSERGHITKCQSWRAPKTFLCSRLPVSNEDTRDHSSARLGDIHSPAPFKLQGSTCPGTPTPCRRMGSACFLPAPHLLIHTSSERQRRRGPSEDRAHSWEGGWRGISTGAWHRLPPRFISIVTPPQRAVTEWEGPNDSPSL